MSGIGPQAISNGLLISLDAANVRSYPGSGTAWNDLSGSNNTATLLNSQGYSSTNGGYIINNNYQSISIAQNTAINNHSGNYTYEMMFRPPSQSVNLYPRMFANCNYLENGLMLVATSNMSDISIKFDFQFGGTSYSAGLVTGAYNKWYHCVFSRIGTTYYAYYFYENTVVRDSGSITFDVTNTNGIKIGANRDNGETSFQHVAIFRRYSIGLTEQQIFQNFNATRGRFGV